MGQGHARIQRGKPGVRTPPLNLKMLPKKVILGFLGGWTPSPRLRQYLTILVGPPLVKMSGSAHKNHPRVIILSNYDGLESSMLHTDFRENRPAGSGEEDF